MQELYAERIAKEASPRFYEEDSGLTDLDAGGLTKPKEALGATTVDRARELQSQPVTQAVGPPPRESPTKKVAIAAVAALVLISLGGFTWWKSQAGAINPPDPVTPPVAINPPDPVKPPEVVKPEAPRELAVRIDSEPTGALVEVGGVRLGLTPVDVRVPHGKLPLPLRVSADGYESADLTLTEMTGASLSLPLKKKATPKSPTGGGKGTSPVIKTTR